MQHTPFPTVAHNMGALYTVAHHTSDSYNVYRILDVRHRFLRLSLPVLFVTYDSSLTNAMLPL